MTSELAFIFSGDLCNINEKYKHLVENEGERNKRIDLNNNNNNNNVLI